jgi:hypothetical protein
VAGHSEILLRKTTGPLSAAAKRTGAESSAT